MKNSAEQTESNEDHMEQEPEIKHIGTPFPICAKCGVELELSNEESLELFKYNEFYQKCYKCKTVNIIFDSIQYTTQIDE